MSKKSIRVWALMSAGLLLLAAGLTAILAQRDGGAARTIKVGARGDLQRALDDARPGDTIVLEAGAVYRGPFTLPAKSGAAYVTVTTSALERLPPAGTRVRPSDAQFMPKLVSTGRGDAALQTEAGAHHYRLVGLEFAPATPDALVYDLIRLGDGDRAQDTPEEVPHHIVVNRSYIHGLEGAYLKRGVSLQSAHTEITDSHISGCKAKGQDAQAVAGWNGPGPYLIENNYLEASGNNLIFGGADPSIKNLVPADIVVRRNHITRPVSWRGQWTVKNLFELKSARRVVVEGNVLENNWADGQEGAAVLFTVRNQDGRAPWSAVEDVRFERNVVRHSGSAVIILGHDYNHPSGPARRITVRHNLFDDIDWQRWGGRGAFMLVMERADEITVDHNTILHSGSLLMLSAGPHAGLVLTNNLAAHNDYGIFGDAVGVGTKALDAYAPGASVRGNVLAGARPDLYPRGNHFPPALSQIGFVNPAAGDYRLRPDSRFKGKAADGTDPGCDFAALSAATAGVARNSP